MGGMLQGPMQPGISSSSSNCPGASDAAHISLTALREWIEECHRACGVDASPHVFASFQGNLILSLANVQALAPQTTEFMAMGVPLLEARHMETQSAQLHPTGGAAERCHTPPANKRRLGTPPPRSPCGSKAAAADSPVSVSSTENGKPRTPQTTPKGRGRRGLGILRRCAGRGRRAVRPTTKRTETTGMQSQLPTTHAQGTAVFQEEPDGDGRKSGQMDTAALRATPGAPDRSDAEEEESSESFEDVGMPKFIRDPATGQLRTDYGEPIRKNKSDKASRKVDSGEVTDRQQSQSSASNSKGPRVMKQETGSNQRKRPQTKHSVFHSGARPRAQSKDVKLELQADRTSASAAVAEVSSNVVRVKEESPDSELHAAKSTKKKAPPSSHGELAGSSSKRCAKAEKAEPAEPEEHIANSGKNSWKTLPSFTITKQATALTYRNVMAKMQEKTATLQPSVTCLKLRSKTKVGAQETWRVTASCGGCSEARCTKTFKAEVDGSHGGTCRMWERGGHQDGGPAAPQCTAKRTYRRVSNTPVIASVPIPSPVQSPDAAILAIASLMKDPVLKWGREQQPPVLLTSGNWDGWVAANRRATCRVTCASCDSGCTFTMTAELDTEKNLVHLRSLGAHGDHAALHGGVFTFECKVAMEARLHDEPDTSAEKLRDMAIKALARRSVQLLPTIDQVTRFRASYLGLNEPLLLVHEVQQYLQDSGYALQGWDVCNPADLRVLECSFPSTDEDVRPVCIPWTSRMMLDLLCRLSDKDLVGAAFSLDGKYKVLWLDHVVVTFGVYVRNNRARGRGVGQLPCWAAHFVPLFQAAMKAEAEPAVTHFLETVCSCEKSAVANCAKARPST